MSTRPSHIPTSHDGPASAVNVRGPALSRIEWLATLKTASIVLVRNGLIHFRAQLTDATPCFLFIGKLKFHRIVGTLVKRQRVNRLNLRIVQTVEEST